MGAIKGTVTVRRYVVRGDASKLDKARLTKGVRTHVFLPIDPASDVVRVHGWASIQDAEELDLDSHNLYVGDALCLTLRVDTLKPPAAVVKRLVAEKLKGLDHKPTKGEKNAAKEEVTRQLRKSYYPQIRTFDVVWKMAEGRVFFWSHGKGANELFVELFKKTFGLDLAPFSPGQIAGRTIPTGLTPTNEMLFGFPGLPGRPTAGDDDETESEDTDA